MDKTLILPIIEEFLYIYLPKEKGRSSNTILSYAYTFQLFFEFMAHNENLEPARIRFEDFQDDTIRDFLFWLDTDRHNGVSTRNQRLSALKAFSAYLEKRHYAVSQRYRHSAGLAEVKKTVVEGFTYFTTEEIKAIFALPFKQNATEQRDRVMLSVLYASGARVQELCDLKVCDLIWGDGSKDGCRLVLHGKWGKVRVVRISPRCTELLKKHLEYTNLNNMLSRDRHVFSSQTHEHMTPSCVSAVVKKYLKRAQLINPQLFNEKNYSPHSFRHSVATHMLAVKISLPTIKNFLGHESIQSTLLYTKITNADIDTALAEYWRHVAESSTQPDSEFNNVNIDLVSKAKQLKIELSE